MNPIRKPTFAGTQQRYDFEDLDVTKFLVKNLSGGDVTVSLEAAATAGGWLIPDGDWQVIPGASRQPPVSAIYVRAEATSATAKGVEIEAIEFLPKRRW